MLSLDEIDEITKFGRHIALSERDLTFVNVSHRYKKRAFHDSHALVVRDMDVLQIDPPQIHDENLEIQ